MVYRKCRRSCTWSAGLVITSFTRMLENGEILTYSYQKWRIAQWEKIHLRNPCLSSVSWIIWNQYLDLCCCRLIFWAFASSCGVLMQFLLIINYIPNLCNTILILRLNLYSRLTRKTRGLAINFFVLLTRLILFFFVSTAYF